ncbi:31128_t:CDS:2 [Gigaspora margarita]|uniref:31128_t:CDS:1 n=1 Tax=Gigaspora margarita TaxID=4874 RepID=A0ABN7UBK2_GIGMA|nr:31128_t:CDS:2 [Gigaspora margarita]
MNYQFILFDFSKDGISKELLIKHLESKLCDLNNAMEKIIYIFKIEKNEIDDIVDQIKRLHCFGGGDRTVAVNKVSNLVEDQDIMLDEEAKEFIKIRNILENSIDKYGVCEKCNNSNTGIK